MKDTNVTQQAGWGGAGFTDQDYIEEFNLDPNQDINKQMLDVVETENIEHFINLGYTDKDARKKSRELKNEAARSINKNKMNKK